MKKNTGVRKKADVVVGRNKRGTPVSTYNVNIKIHGKNHYEQHIVRKMPITVKRDSK